VARMISTRSKQDRAAVGRPGHLPALPRPRQIHDPRTVDVEMSLRGPPERLELRAIRLPPGDHDGYSPQSVRGTRRCPDPSAFMPAVRLLPEAPPPGAYAIIEPPGDQAGKPPSRVSRCRPDPSAFMTQTSGCPRGSICDEAAAGRQRRVEFGPGRVR